MNIEQAKQVQEFNKAEGRANAIMNQLLIGAKRDVAEHPVLRHLACANGEGELSHALRFGQGLDNLVNGCRDYRIKKAEIMVKKCEQYIEHLLKSNASDKAIQEATSSLTIYRNDLQMLASGGF